MNFSGKLKLIRFNVELEDQNNLPKSAGSSDKRESLPEALKRKQIS